MQENMFDLIGMRIQQQEEYGLIYSLKHVALWYVNWFIPSPNASPKGAFMYEKIGDESYRQNCTFQHAKVHYLHHALTEVQI